jgi:dihydrofolate reductase
MLDPVGGGVGHNAPAVPRPRCSVFIATSLDGFIARRDGGIDWLSIVETPGEDYGYARFFDDVGALILGRGTYDTVLGFSSWPYGDKPCVVFTHRPPPAARHRERFHAGAPGPLLAELHEAGVRRVYVDGGGLIRSFLRENLIDDITLSIIPVVLGDGIPLFGAEIPERRLRLAGSQAFASGLVQLRYELAADFQS